MPQPSFRDYLRKTQGHRRSTDLREHVQQDTQPRQDNRRSLRLSQSFSQPVSILSKKRSDHRIEPVGSNLRLYLAHEEERASDDGSLNLRHTLRLIKYFKSEIDRFKYTVAVRDENCSGPIWNICVARLRNVLTYSQIILDIPHLAIYHTRFVRCLVQIPPTLDKYMCHTFRDTRELECAFDEIEALTKMFEDVLSNIEFLDTLSDNENGVEGNEGRSGDHDRFDGADSPVDPKNHAGTSAGYHGNISSPRSPRSGVSPYNLISPREHNRPQHNPSFDNCFPILHISRHAEINRRKKRSVARTSRDPVSFQKLLHEHELARNAYNPPQSARFEGREISRPRKLIKPESVSVNPVRASISSQMVQTKLSKAKLERHRDKILETWLQVSGVSQAS